MDPALMSEAILWNDPDVPLPEVFVVSLPVSAGRKLERLWSAGDDWTLDRVNVRLAPAPGPARERWDAARREAQAEMADLSPAASRDHEEHRALVSVVLWAFVLAAGDRARPAAFKTFNMLAHMNMRRLVMWFSTRADRDAARLFEALLVIVVESGKRLEPPVLDVQFGGHQDPGAKLLS